MQRAGVFSALARGHLIEVVKDFWEIEGVQIADRIGNDLDGLARIFQELLGPLHSGLEQVFLGAEVVEFLEKGGQIAAVDIEVIGNGWDGEALQIIVFFDYVAAFLTNLLRLTQLLDGPIGTEAADVKEQGIGQTQEFQMPVGGLDLGLGFGNQLNDLLG